MNRAICKFEKSRRYDMIRRAVTVTFLVLIAVFLYGTCEAYAYDTPKFDVDVTINEDYSFDYVENITVRFDYRQHGIFRNIPLDMSYRIENIQVDGFKKKVYSEDGFKIIQIGDAKTYVSGEVTYPIRYTLRGKKDEYDDRDFAYLDLLPTGWQSSIDHAHIVVHYPESMDISKLLHYVGAYGERNQADASDNWSWTVDTAGREIIFDGRDLDRGIGVTLDIELPEGYWKNPLSYDWMKTLAIFIAAATAVVIAGLRLSWGKNPRVVDVVEFYPPDDMSPLHVGYLIDGTVDRDDITSTFFYLADKGYMDIKEYSKGNFEFTRLDVPENEPDSIRRFFRGVFGSHAMDDIATTDDKYNVAKSKKIGSRMSTAYADIPDIVKEEVARDLELFSKKSKTADKLAKLIFFFSLVIIGIFCGLYLNEIQEDGSVVVIVAVIMATVLTLLIVRLCTIYYSRQARTMGIASGMLHFILWLMAYAFASFAYLFIYGSFGRYGTAGYMLMSKTALFSSALLILAPILIIGMRSRTGESAELLGRIRGFREFIRTAELPKLEELVEQDPNYFYNILPYAYIFGLTKKWVKKFENIAISDPGWYHPYGGMSGSGYSHGSYMMDQAMNSVAKNISQRMITADRGMSRSSGGGFFSGGGGGGGFSGGGFSGGGFGGGGGGTW